MNDIEKAMRAALDGTFTIVDRHMGDTWTVPVPRDFVPDYMQDLEQRRVIDAMTKPPKTGTKK